MSEPLIQDQEDIAGRLAADAYFADITVLIQRRGVTESDIEVALSVLNEKIGKIGACAILAMPSIVPDNPDTPNPEYFIELGVQVITAAMFNENTASGGTGKQAEEIAERVRQLIHRVPIGRSTYSFNRMEPVDRPEGQVSYGVIFRRRHGDVALQRCGIPLIEPDEGATPVEVTLSAQPGDAPIWYTLDDTYPSSANPNATLYTAPFTIAAAARLRAAAQKTGLQQSGVAEATFT